MEAARWSVYCYGLVAMRISHRHKFILIANPKCASQSLRHLLDPYSTIRGRKDFPYNSHVTARRLKRHFDESGWDWFEYNSLTTVRHPWDRMVSFWVFANRQPRSIWAALAQRTGNFQDFIRYFSDYLRETVMPPREGQHGFDIAQIAFSESGQQLVDDIIPVECLAARLPAVLRRIGLEPTDLPQLNSSPREGWQRYYTTSECVDLVAELFEPDIGLFGYRFDSLAPERSTITP